MPFAIGFLQRQLIGRVPVPTTSFQGKTVIVTGSNVGLGLESCRWFVRLGAAKVILACRSVEKGKAAAKNIRESTGCSSETLDIWQLDMVSHGLLKSFPAPSY
jgi:NAD(P)-dependent dehydrogenase (short-subunit alcohol dehydrogenase family)